MSSTGVDRILDGTLVGRRLTGADAEALLGSTDLVALGRAADAVCRAKHPEPYRTYAVDRNINYTNICTCGCAFCAFSRRPGDADGYVISDEELDRKVAETVALGGTHILLQGGMNPELRVTFFEDMFRRLRSRWSILIHGLSPPEIQYLARLEGLPVEAVLGRLRDAGLSSIPGGGAEILADRVRAQVSPRKGTADEWLEVMRVWHRMGGRSSATMMYGHVETPADRVEHLERLRRLQDETGGFLAFICWPFQPGDTPLASRVTVPGAFDYLRTLAVARLFLDNVPNVQASWVTQGDQIGQLALRFGANDMGGLMIEENVVAAAGARHAVPLQRLRHLIADAGFEPRQRDVFYRLVDERAAVAGSGHGP